MAEVKSSLIKTGKPRRKQRPANPREGLSDPDWVWAACAIAGEGTFYINRQGKANDPRPRYCAGVRAYNTNRAFLEILLGDFGGIIYPFPSRTERWKDSFVWVLNGKDASWFAGGVLPHLRTRKALKVQQAENVRALVELQRGAPHRRTDEELAEAERLYHDTVRLNRKGPPATTEREDTSLTVVV